MAGSARRTATFDAEVLEGTRRGRNSADYRRAPPELAGNEPTTESAVLNELAKIALRVVERRALEIGYRRLADVDTSERDDVADFLEAQALAGFEYDDGEDGAPLLEFLARESR
jgi:hypothetical protein